MGPFEQKFTNHCVHFHHSSFDNEESLGFEKLLKIKKTNEKEQVKNHFKQEK